MWTTRLSSLSVASGTGHHSDKRTSRGSLSYGCVTAESIVRVCGCVLVTSMRTGGAMFSQRNARCERRGLLYIHSGLFGCAISRFPAPLFRCLSPETTTKNASCWLWFGLAPLCFTAMFHSKKNLCPPPFLCSSLFVHPLGLIFVPSCLAHASACCGRCRSTPDRCVAYLFVERTGQGGNGGVLVLDASRGGSSRVHGGRRPVCRRRHLPHCGLLQHRRLRWAKWVGV